MFRQGTRNTRFDGLATYPDLPKKCLPWWESRQHFHKKRTSENQSLLRGNPFLSYLPHLLAEIKITSNQTGTHAVIGEGGTQLAEASGASSFWQPRRLHCS